MNRQLTRNLLWPTAAALVGACLILLVAPLLRAQSTVDDGRAAQSYYYSHGITATVKKFGKYIHTEPAHESLMLAADLKTLAARSDLVIVGVPLGNRCRLSADDFHVLTEYDVRVDETLKGEARIGDTVQVNLPGGRVEFPGGGFALGKTLYFTGMIDGSRYVLFLERNPSDPDNPLLASTEDTRSYRLTLQSQGLFDIPNGGSAKSHARRGAPVHVAARGKGAGRFLDEVRDAVQGRPK